MINYENNTVMKQYINRIKEAGEIIRSAKHDVFGISEKTLMTTEETAYHIERMAQEEFTDLSEKLSKRMSNEACDTIIAMVHLAMNHPELINDIEYAVQGAMKRY
jgi:F0F1-type ATP synthase membrane subunit b/b'